MFVVCRWPTSIVFSHWWFGSAFGNPENDYQIKDGYFANISSVFDPYDNLVDPRISPMHNPYGYLGGSYDYTVGYVRSCNSNGSQLDR